LLSFYSAPSLKCDPDNISWVITGLERFGAGSSYGKKEKVKIKVKTVISRIIIITMNIKKWVPFT
jgi:hypothetical protein